MFACVNVVPEQTRCCGQFGLPKMGLNALDASAESTLGAHLRLPQ
jgi:hypothetical protein